MHLLTGSTYVTRLKRWLLLASAVLLVASTAPAGTVLAQAAEDEVVDEGSPVIIEEYYRENNINFFGRDIGGCGAGGAAGGATEANINVDKDFSLGTDPKERRVNLAKALMKDYGLSPAQAAGIVGNFVQEAGEDLPPDINQGGHRGPPGSGAGYGWAQWTGPRRESFVGWSVANGYVPSASVPFTDAANYAYLKHELNTGYKDTITEIKATTTPGDAAFSFHKTFEKSADSRSQIGEREAAANQVLQEMGGGAGGGATGGAGGGSCPGQGEAAIAGDFAFPLETTRADMDSQNPGLFANGTTGEGGHPYTAYDILASPGTPVLASLGGTVTMITQDRCPGRMVSIHSPDKDMTISYLHMNMNAEVAEGDTIEAGQRIGEVGPPGAGCGTAHLHIDAAQGDSRPGCSRLNCPSSNASKFIDIGPDLFKSYEQLP